GGESARGRMARESPAIATPPPRAPTPAAARPMPAAKPAAPAKPATPPKAATPAKPSPALASDEEDGFDLRNLVAEEDDAPSLRTAKPARKVLTTPPPTPAPRPSPAKPAPAAEKKKDGDDDDLDALFDEIQIGD